MSEKTKILIVDDDRGIRETLSDVLEKEGYKIYAASDGKACLGWVKKNRFNIVILDIVLPDIDGIEILKEIKRLTPEIEVIMITGHATLANSIKALNEGAYAYILKPFNPEEVKAIISRAVEKQRISLERDKLLVNLQESNKELKETQDELIREERLAALGELSASVAHELNNYQAIAQLSAEWLLLHLKKPLKLREEIERIKTQIERSTEITKGLLEYAKKRRLKMGYADINRVVDGAISVTKPLIGVGGYRLIKDYSTNIPKLKVNEDRLQQVFVNLLLNAFHAMPEGGEIKIKTGVQSGKKLARIDISDTGPGIPPSKINKIFTSFFTTGEKEGGMGLGLSISLGIVKQHNGHIDVKSRIGKGTTFTVSLPINPAPSREGAG